MRRRPPRRVDLGLSPFIQKKMKLPYMLHGFKSTDEFIHMLGKHEISIWEKDLEGYEREGWLQPAFRLVFPEDQRQSDVDLYLGTDAIQQYYAAGHVEIPQEGDHEPWSRFKAGPRSTKRDRKLLYYHPLQILQVKNILQHKSVRFPWRDSYSKSDIEAIISNVETHMQQRDDWFNTVQTRTARDIGMLMLVEESYGIYVYDRISIPLTIRREQFMDQWWEWKNGYAAADLLQYCGASIEQVRGLHDQIVADIRFLDPLLRWHDLIRIMRPRVLEQVSGNVRTARMYHAIAGMLARFLHDLDGRDGEPNMPFDDVDAEWKKSMYSDPFDYRTHKTRQAIVRHYIRETATRLYLLVEGKTEKVVIEKILGSYWIGPDGIVMVLDSEGVTNMFKGSIPWLIRSACEDSIIVYIIADNEADWNKEMGKIRQEFSGPFNRLFGHHIWNTSFEEDNFGRASVIALINSYIRGHGQSLSEDEVTAIQQKSEKGLFAAAEHAYGKKYENSLLHVIGKTKVDLALELMECTRQNRHNGGELEIEKVLKKALGMITY